MDQLAAHRRAQEAFAGVLVRVKSDQLEDATPCSDWTVRDVIDHVIAGNWRVAGRPETTPAETDELVAAHAESASVAEATFSAPDGLTRIFDIRIGPVPGSAFIVLRTVDALVHAWDIAKATGQATDVDPEVASAMLDMSRQRI